MHEVEAQHPHPQRLVMAGQHRAGQIAEAAAACIAPVSLPMRLGVITPRANQCAAGTAGHRTPSGQRCWRTRAKHLAPPSKNDRLTRSEAPIAEPPAPNRPQVRIPLDPHQVRQPSPQIPVRVVEDSLSKIQIS